MLISVWWVDWNGVHLGETLVYPDWFQCISYNVQLFQDITH